MRCPSHPGAGRGPWCPDSLGRCPKGTSALPGAGPRPSRPAAAPSTSCCLARHGLRHTPHLLGWGVCPCPSWGQEPVVRAQGVAEAGGSECFSAWPRGPLCRGKWTPGNRYFLRASVLSPGRPRGTSSPARELCLLSCFASLSPSVLLEGPEGQLLGQAVQVMVLLMHLVRSLPCQQPWRETPESLILPPVLPAVGLDSPAHSRTLCPLCVPGSLPPTPSSWLSGTLCPDTATLCVVFGCPWGWVPFKHAKWLQVAHVAHRFQCLCEGVIFRRERQLGQRCLGVSTSSLGALRGDREACSEAEVQPSVMSHPQSGHSSRGPFALGVVGSVSPGLGSSALWLAHPTHSTSCNSRSSGSISARVMMGGFLRCREVLRQTPVCPRDPS